MGNKSYDWGSVPLLAIEKVVSQETAEYIAVTGSYIEDEEPNAGGIIIFVENGTEELTNGSTLEGSLGAEAATVGGQSVLVNVIASIIFVFSILSNLAVLFVTIRRIFRARKASSVHWLLCNLAVADILVTSLLLPAQVGWVNQGPWSTCDKLCRTHAFFKVFGLYLSGASVVCISVDRYYAVCKPFHITNAVRRAIVMIIVAWIGSGLLSSPEAFRYHVYGPASLAPLEFCVVAPLSIQVELAYAVMQLMFFSGLPFLVMLFCYGGILSELCRRQAGGVRRSAGSDVLGRAKLRALKLFIIIAVAYIICWTPTHVIAAWSWIDLESELMIDPQRQMVLLLFSFFNPCLNPILYGFFHLRR